MKMDYNSIEDLSEEHYYVFEKQFPIETSVNYIYEPYEIMDHVEMLSRSDNMNLAKKLNDFKVKEILNNDNLDYQKFSKKQVDFSDFFVEKIFNLGFVGGREKNIYSDSPYVYLLGRGKEYGAILTMAPRPDAMLVSQLQGFKGRENIWHNIRYSDFLLDTSYNDLKGFGISEMWVSPYFRSEYKEVRTNFQNTKKRQYDIPAKRQGFDFDEEKGLWVKKF